MKLMKNLTILTVGGLAYGLVEIAWRGETHISMFLVGGLCFLIIGYLDEFNYKPSLITQAAISSAVVTTVEFMSGVIINIILGLRVWDYSEMPFNVLGQICMPFSGLWFLLSIPAIYLDDIIRSAIFGEEMKKLRLLPELKRPEKRTTSG